MSNLYDLYAKLDCDDRRIYDMLVRLRVQLLFDGKVTEDITDYELAYCIGILENRLGLREWHDAK